MALVESIKVTVFAARTEAVLIPMATRELFTSWTLRATDIRGVNIASANAVASLNSKRIVRTSDGTLNIQIGKMPVPGVWLELSGNGDFQLILTFYDASIFAGLGSSVIELPTITKVGCA